MTRLPVVGSDSNAWGAVLNGFLGVAHNADGSLKQMISVTDYGASPSNTPAQNDTAIAAAIAAGGVSSIIYFPSGTYLISATINVTANNVALVSLGGFNTTNLVIDSSADPTYAISVASGATHCSIIGLTIQGRSNNTSTGGGVHWSGTQGKIERVVIDQFGGTGLLIDTTGAEMYLNDVDFYQNGRNTITPGDNLVITSTVGDSEYHRVISAGDAAKSTTRNGFFVNGPYNQKFIDCHAYFCSNDGLKSFGPNTQIIGGEYETNTSSGIECGAAGTVISGVSCFANGAADILTTGQASIFGCVCSSTTASQNIYANAAAGGVISDCILSGAVQAINLDTGASGYNVHDNNCTASTATVLRLLTTNSDIHDNTILSGKNIVEITGAQGNNIHDNMLIGGGTITQIGTTTRLKNNVGFNPRGHSVTQPAVPASTVAVTNTTGCDCMVLVKGGTLTAITIGGTATGITAAAAAGSAYSLRVPVGSSIAITYSVAPTWDWFGD